MRLPFLRESSSDEWRARLKDLVCPSNIQEAARGAEAIFLRERRTPGVNSYGTLLAKVKADPDITISPAKTISIPGSAKLLYVFEIAQSPRRPHLPSQADQRVFCGQRT
jgi:hypothetical protein